MKSVKVLVIVLLAMFSYSAVSAQPRHHRRVHRKHRVVHHRVHHPRRHR